jgi:hypothetical protein
MPDYDFDELYPGRFIKAAMFKGKAVTLTIKEIMREEFPVIQPKPGQSATEFKVVLSFKERDKQIIANKTNCTALMLMFGRNTKEWRGKRVTFFGLKGTWFKRKQEAIRIYGSPDIAADVEVTVRLGQSDEDFRLRKVTLGKRVEVPVPAAEPEPELEEEQLEPGSDYDAETGEVPFAMNGGA